ncbi:hypothetical protein [Streptosporangium sp. NPDC020145]|uniref:hypothetical protein n=1 Tax=Streptosporangium sp. NPDC020145 TaxID=3154694 RepID=UPI003433DC04
MIRRLRAIERRVAFRGSVLLFLALWSGGQVARLTLAPPVTPTTAYLASIAPLPVLAIPWAACTVLCAAQAFTVTDWHAFALTAGVLVTWAVLYLVGGLRSAIPQGYWACIIQIVMAGLVLRISRWPDPPRER